MPSSECPSVTRIIADMGLSPDFDAIPGKHVDRASARGTRIHAVVACELTATAYAAHEHAREASNDERVVALEMCDWLDKYGYTETIAVEQRIYHATRRFNGQPDWVMRNPVTGKCAVIDTKTGTQKCKAHRVQVGGGYVELVLDAGFTGIPRDTSRVNVDAVIVYTAGAHIEVDRLTPVEIVVAWQRFQEALNLWWFRHDAGTLPAKKETRR